MADLRKRFGQLVAAHRRRRGMTQDDLAEAASLSPEMVAKIETGRSGARFPVIERLAAALDADPAEFFTTAVPSGVMQKGAFGALSVRLVGLPENELVWLSKVIDALLSAKTEPRASQSPKPLSAQRPTRRSKGPGKPS